MIKTQQVKDDFIEDYKIFQKQVLKGLGVSPQYVGICPQCSSDLEQGRFKFCPICGWEEYPF